jgi:acyl-coenzyme A synthetase/AMP-(fatty) acid ligase
MEHAAGRLAHYKRIRRYEFVAAIPHTASGKIMRRELIERERMAGQPGHG